MATSGLKPQVSNRVVEATADQVFRKRLNSLHRSVMMGLSSEFLRYRNGNGVFSKVRQAELKKLDD